MEQILDKLQQVRSLREQLAQSELAEGRHRLNQADHELSSKQTLLENHRLLQSKKQELLFKGIGSRKVSLAEFESYSGRISDLRTEEKNHQANVQQAEKQKDLAFKEVDRLCVVLHKRCRESTKLKEFHNTWTIKVEKEKNQRQEEEMEEIFMNRLSQDDADK